MTLNQLKYAIIVAESESFNEAAKKLFISQPSLSTSIHSLDCLLYTSDAADEL